MSRRMLSLFRNLFRKTRVEQALDDELQSSVELLTEEKMKEGYPRLAARREALMELGGVEQVKQQVRTVRTGAFWRTSPGTSFLHSAPWPSRPALRPWLY